MYILSGMMFGSCSFYLTRASTCVGDRSRPNTLQNKEKRSAQLNTSSSSFFGVISIWDVFSTGYLLSVLIESMTQNHSIAFRVLLEATGIYAPTLDVVHLKN